MGQNSRQAMSVLQEKRLNRCPVPLPTCHKGKATVLLCILFVPFLYNPKHCPYQMFGIQARAELPVGHYKACTIHFLKSHQGSASE